MPADLELAKEQLGKAIGRLASGVYVLTCEYHDESHGILLTWIAQTGFKPPLISLAVNTARPILAELKEHSKFVINVLSKKNMDIFKNFAKPDLLPAERFAGLNLLTKTKSGPVFADAIAYMDCRVEKVIEAYDHNLILAEVMAGEVLDSESEPMIHLRKSGFQY